MKAQFIRSKLSINKCTKLDYGFGKKSIQTINRINFMRIYDDKENYLSVTLKSIMHEDMKHSQREMRFLKSDLIGKLVLLYRSFWLINDWVIYGRVRNT